MSIAVIFATLIAIAVIVMLLTGRASPNHSFALEMVKRLADEEADSPAGRASRPAA
ncbi:MAG: hypothetical protein LAN64_00645 [Acidobacteriia bacterium]|nr:hypothetical protein [Terriglobia bacterium]